MPSTKHYLRGTPPQLERFGDEQWRERAACHNHPRLPASTWDDTVAAEDDDVRRQAPGAREQRIAAAKVVCRTECTVRAACLAAVDLNYDEGVRGGEDLRAVRTARRRAGVTA